MILSMKEFDIILGIDWLTKYRATLDCASKSITFMIHGSQSFCFQCNPLNDAFITSHLAANQGTSSEITVTDIPVVREFEDVFKDISGLPPK